MKCNLTNLKSRKSLMKTILNRDDLLITVLSVNNLKETNLYFGDKMGDDVLIYISKKMKEYFNEDEYQMFRVYGPTFVIVSFHSNYEEKIEHIKKFIHNIENYEHNLKENVYVQLSAGISAGHNAFNLAEDALKEAKENEQCMFVNIENENYKLGNFYKETEMLKKALETDNIVPYFQPIKDIKNNSIKKYETLARLKDGDKIVSPFHFIRAAKKARLYSRVTKVIIEKSFIIMSKLDVEFSINLDMTDFKNDDTINYLFAMIEKYDIANKLIVEFLETYELESDTKVMKVFNTLKQKGVRLAIDDFGTGYSNFSLLQVLQPDFLKIDGSLVKNITNENSFKTLKAITALAQSLEIKTIAEYVESEEIYNLSKKAGVDNAQGYFISKPRRDLF